MTHTPRTTSDAMIKPPVANRITLPALPFAIHPATTDETAPRAPMIRCEMTPEMKRWLRGATRASMVNKAPKPYGRESLIMREVGIK